MLLISPIQCTPDDDAIDIPTEARRLVAVAQSGARLDAWFDLEGWAAMSFEPMVLQGLLKAPEAWPATARPAHKRGTPEWGRDVLHVVRPDLEEAPLRGCEVGQVVGAALLPPHGKDDPEPIFVTRPGLELVVMLAMSCTGPGADPSTGAVVLSLTQADGYRIVDTVDRSGGYWIPLMDDMNEAAREARATKPR